MHSPMRWTEWEPAGLARFLAIVLATFAGSIGCWIWVLLLFAVGDALGAAPRAGTGASLVHALMHPMAWVGGAWCGLFLVFPALACLWPRRLLPGLVFVCAIGFGTATGMIGSTRFGGGLQQLAAALPVTAIATVASLLVVRCVPLAVWKRARGTP